MREEMKAVAKLLEAEKAQEAKDLFLKLEAEETVEYFFLRGKLEQKFQNWGEAMNAFNKVLEIDPENSEALSNLKMVQDILSFWNPEMFNP